MIIPFAQQWFLMPDPVDKRNHRNVAGNNVGMRCFLEKKTCGQDVALTFVAIVVIKLLVLMQEIMALNWSVLPAPLLRPFLSET